MTTIATLAVKLQADANGFISAMDQAERRSQTWSQNVSKNLKEVGGKITDFGKMATFGLTLPILGAGVAAVRMASDLEETKNKVNVVFGDMTTSVLEWSKNSASTMGQSQQQALEAAGTYGNLFVSLGLGQRPAADMSMSLVQLASDMASFNNADPSEVLLALRSGLSGEIEPLKKYGVAMNDSILKTKAMEMGFGDNLQALTEAQKLQVRYAIILGQTTTAQGDFARTADGLANSTRIAKAQLADAAATLGQQLLPYALKLVNWISQAIGWFEQLTPAQQKWIIIILGTVAVIGPLLIIVGSLVTAIGAIIPVITAVAAALAPFALPIIAIIAALALLYFAWTNNWGGIQEKTAAVIAFIKGIIDGGMKFISDLTSGKLGAISEYWNNMVSSVMAIINTFIANAKLLFQAFQAALNGDWYRFGELLRQMWDNTWKMMGTILSNAWANFKIIVSTLVTNITNFFRTTDWGAVGRNIVEGIANGIRNGATAISNAAMSAARAALKAVQGFLGIHSESKVFKAQVGWEIGAGTASGVEESLRKLMPAAFGMLQPATVPMPSVAGMSGGGGVSAGRGASGVGGDERVIQLLEAIADKDRIDYVKLARVVRDAVLMRAQ